MALGNRSLESLPCPDSNRTPLVKSGSLCKQFESNPLGLLNQNCKSWPWPQEHSKYTMEWSSLHISTVWLYRRYPCGVKDRNSKEKSATFSLQPNVHRSTFLLLTKGSGPLNFENAFNEKHSLLKTTSQLNLITTLNETIILRSGSSLTEPASRGILPSPLSVIFRRQLRHCCFSFLFPFLHLLWFYMIVLCHLFLHVNCSCF